MQWEFNLTFKNTLDKIINESLPQFVSGNDIPVTKATVTRSDLYILLTKNLMESTIREQTL